MPSATIRRASSISDGPVSEAMENVLRSVDALHEVIAQSPSIEAVERRAVSELRAINGQLVIDSLRSQAEVAEAIVARDEARAASEQAVGALSTSDRHRRESLARLGAELHTAIAPIVRAVAAMGLQVNEPCGPERAAIQRGLGVLMALVDDAVGAKAPSGAA